MKCLIISHKPETHLNIQILKRNITKAAPVTMNPLEITFVSRVAEMADTPVNIQNFVRSKLISMDKQICILEYNLANNGEAAVFNSEFFSSFPQCFFFLFHNSPAIDNELALNVPNAVNLTSGKSNIVDYMPKAVGFLTQ